MQYLELHIYDKKDTLILSNQNLSNWYLKDNIDEITGAASKRIIFNIHNYLRNQKINSGQYNLCLFVKESLYEDTLNDTFKISSIANNRNELIIETKNYDIFLSILNLLQANTDQLILNFNNNDTFEINNWSLTSDSNLKRISISSKGTKYKIAIKLNEELPAKISLNSLVSIEKIIYDKVWQDIGFVQKNKEYDVNVLTRPNFDIKINKNSKEETTYLSWEDLVSTNTEIKNLLENNYFSFYEQTATLNVDFEDFSNFVFYSSAEHRLINFKYKVQQIEDLNENISNVSISSYQETYQNDIQELLLSLDAYEKFLYYDSSSLYSWPKDSSGSLEPIEDVTTWYEGMIDSAITYDDDNIAALRKNIPEFIMNDEYSSQFFIFIDLIAQHFDVLWLYIKHIGYLHNKSEGITSGLSKDLIYHMLISYGWEPSQNNQFEDLWKYILGTQDETELELIDETDQVFTAEMLDKEIWKRILNNLPYLLKTKGTKEGIRALINCYGIPKTELAIREYGGPNKINVKSLNIIDKFAYAIKLTSDSNIIVPYYAPGSIEFRFKLTDKEDQTLFIREDGGIALNTINVDDMYGYIEFEIDAYTFTSDQIPIYDENWWSFLLRSTTNVGEYEIFLKSAKYNKINYEYSGSFDISGSLAYSEFIDTTQDYYIGFEGRMQEFRYWNTSLNEEAFDNHVLSPTSYNGNASIAPWEELIYRLTLGTDTIKYNHFETTYITSQHPQAGMTFADCIIDGGESTSGSYDIVDGGDATSGSYDEIDGGDSDDITCGDIANAYFENFPNEYNYEIVVEQYAHEWPDTGGNRNISNKIRIEDNELITNLDLNLSAEQSSYDLAPIDNAKIGVYFGPNLEVTQDIAEYMAGINIDNYIGTSDNEYATYYNSLRLLKEYYLQQYFAKYNVVDYFRLMPYFNNSLFHHLDDITPARSVVLSGLVIEPHILNRSKIRLLRSKPSADSLTYDIEYDLKPTSTFAGNEYLYNEGTLTADVNSKLSGESIGYDAEIIYNHYLPSQYIRYNTYFDTSGNQQLIQNPYWYSEGVITIIENAVESIHTKIENPLYGYISGSLEFLNARVQDYKGIGFERLYYKGCKMVSSNWNEPSDDMFDKSPIVEYWESQT